MPCQKKKRDPRSSNITNMYSCAIRSPGFWRLTGTRYNGLVKHTTNELTGHLFSSYFDLGSQTFLNLTVQRFVFVQYIIHLHRQKAYFDEHWAPYHTLIFPCQIQYDFIGKLENQREDAQQVLLTGFHMNDTVQFPNETRKHSTGSSAASAERAYKNIPEKHMEQLREVYKLDFMLFGYDPHGFS